jgi:hypothetical protein
VLSGICAGRSIDSPELAATCVSSVKQKMGINKRQIIVPARWVNIWIATRLDRSVIIAYRQENLSVQ